MEDIFTHLGKLYGLPGYALITVLCVVITVCLERWKRFPNDGILLCIVLLGAVMNSVIADPISDALPFRIWLFKNAIVGAICGFAAWFSRRKLLKRFLNGTEGNTDIIKKQDTK